MSNDDKIYPQYVILSDNGGIEFPADWTLDERHLNVVFVNDFSKIVTVSSETERDRIEHMNIDWFSDTKHHLVLFQDREVFNRFKTVVPNPRAKARVVTDGDRRMYAI